MFRSKADSSDAGNRTPRFRRHRPASQPLLPSTALAPDTESLRRSVEGCRAALAGAAGPSETAQIYLHAGEALSLLHEDAEALDAFTRALESWRELPEAWLGIGMLR